MFREMGDGLLSLAQEGLSNEWIHDGIQNALGSRKFKALVAAGMLSTAYDSSVGINHFRNGEYMDTSSSAIHVVVELAAVEGLRRLIPGYVITIDQNPITEPQTSQPQIVSNVLSLSNG